MVKTRRFKRLTLLLSICLLSASLLMVGCQPKESVSGESPTTTSGEAAASSTAADSYTAQMTMEDGTASQGSGNTPVTPNKGQATTGVKPTAGSTRTTARATTTAAPAKTYGDVRPQAYAPSVKPSMTGTLTVDPAKVINASIIGGGVNFAFSDYVYYDFTQDNGFDLVLPHGFGVDEAEDKAWENYYKMIDYSGMQYVRLQVSYTQWEPINDNNDPNNTDFGKGFVFSPNFKKRADAVSVPENTYLYMEKMYRLLDYFEKKGLYVILGNWSGGQAAGGFCPGGKNWLAQDSVPDRKGLYVKSTQEFAESFAAIMYHLIKEKGYTCVKGFSIFNEPEHFNSYATVLSDTYNQCAAQLTRLGIRNRVKIQGVDGAMMWTAESGEGTKNLQGLLDRCAGSMDLLSVHHYVSTIEAGPVNGSMQGTIQSRLIKNFVKPAVAMAGSRPVVVGELGTFAYSDGKPVEYGTSTLKLPLFNAEAATAIFNTGAKGYGLWIYNGTIHTYFTMLRRNPANKYQLIPETINYYPSALMMKYLPSGTNIVQNAVSGCELDGKQRVFATVGVKNGQTTILLVNDSSESAKISIKGVNSAKSYQYHYVTEGKTDRIYPGQTQQLTDGTIVALRPSSITVLTTYTYGTQTVR